MLEKLEVAVDDAKTALANAKDELRDYICDPKNNVYESVEDARYELEDRLHNFAFQDCQGAHNFGDEEYSHEFIVDGTLYEITMRVVYNRYDKMYYYVDEHTFEIIKKD